MEVDNNNNTSNNVDMMDTVVKCCGTNLKNSMMSDEPGVESACRCVSTQVLQSLYDLRQNNLLCDAVLRLDDGGVFPVHRAILSACSTYFRFVL